MTRFKSMRKWRSSDSKSNNSNNNNTNGNEIDVTTKVISITIDNNSDTSFASDTESYVDTASSEEDYTFESDDSDAEHTNCSCSIIPPTIFVSKASMDIMEEQQHRPRESSKNGNGTVNEPKKLSVLLTKVKSFKRSLSDRVKSPRNATANANANANVNVNGQGNNNTDTNNTTTKNNATTTITATLPREKSQSSSHATPKHSNRFSISRVLGVMQQDNNNATRTNNNNTTRIQESEQSPPGVPAGTCNTNDDEKMTGFDWFISTLPTRSFMKVGLDEVIDSLQCTEDEIENSMLLPNCASDVGKPNEREVDISPPPTPVLKSPRESRYSKTFVAEKYLDTVVTESDESKLSDEEEEVTSVEEEEVASFEEEEEITSFEEDDEEDDEADLFEADWSNLMNRREGNEWWSSTPTKIKSKSEPKDQSEVLIKLLDEVKMLKAKLREVENERRYADEASTWTTLEDQQSFDSDSASLSHGLIFYGDGKWGYEDSRHERKRLNKLQKQRCSLKRLLKKQKSHQYSKNVQ